ncbi:MarR family winged helix-turn-helix transcriptional regulator [Burkholderia sp. PAMC 28687]|uniref:MarR family winged helix-turn-helix transcriptional regulator n=1 Tax=Burkholderia sp. PAMC 28687 TaxID=1795874 RepID=UPI002FF52500
MTPTQFSIVSALERAPDMTMAELAQAMVMERTTVVRVLQPLLRNGLVSAELGGPCQRRLQLTLTQIGQARLADALRYWHAAQEEFEAKFGRRQAARLRRELFRLTSE